MTQRSAGNILELGLTAWRQFLADWRKPERPSGTDSATISPLEKPLPDLSEAECAQARPELISRFTIELSSACNLRCKYCHQSIEGFTPLAPMTDALFDQLIAFCQAHGIKHIDCTGSGEATFAPNWRDKCNRLLDLGIQLSLTTNMARLLKYDDWETLSRFAEITLSIDTADRDLLRKVRKAEDVRTLVYNFAMMRAAAIRHGRKPPFTVFCMVLSSEIIAGMDWLAALAVALGVDLFRVQDVIEFSDIKDRVTPLWQLVGQRARDAADDIDRWLAVFDANPGTRLSMPDQLRQQIADFCASARSADGVMAVPEHFNIAYISTSATPPGPGQTRDCLDPWTFTQIMSDGSVHPCCGATFFVGKIGDETSLEDALNSQTSRDLRLELLSGNLRPDCRGCSFRSITSIENLNRRLRETIRDAPLT